MVQGKAKRKMKSARQVLPVTIKNKVNNHEELLQCLVDDEGHFEGFCEVKNVREVMHRHKRNGYKKLKVFRRMQVVQRERIVKGDKRQPVCCPV